MTGERLGQIREDLLLTIEELSDRIDIREEVLEEWEASHVDPVLSEWLDLRLWILERDTTLEGHDVCDWAVEAGEAVHEPDEEAVAKHVKRCDSCRARLAVVQKSVRAKPIESTPLIVCIITGIAGVGFWRCRDSSSCCSRVSAASPYRRPRWPACWCWSA